MAQVTTKEYLPAASGAAVLWAADRNLSGRRNEANLDVPKRIVVLPCGCCREVDDPQFLSRLFVENQDGVFMNILRHVDGDSERVCDTPIVAYKRWHVNSVHRHEGRSGKRYKDSDVGCAGVMQLDHQRPKRPFFAGV